MRPRRAIRGQALVELAIFGSLFLMAMALMVRIGLRFNYQQELKMEAFRDGLFYLSRSGQARDTQEAGVQWTVMRDRQVPTPGDPMGLNPRTQYVGTSSLVYGRHLFQTILGQKKNGKGGRPMRLVYNVNGTIRDIGDDELPESPLSKPDHDVTAHDPKNSGIEVKVIRNIVQHGMLARNDGAAVATHTDANEITTITTRWVKPGTDEDVAANLPPVINTMKQETIR